LHLSAQQTTSQNNLFSFVTAEAFLQLRFRIGRHDPQQAPEFHRTDPHRTQQFHHYFIFRITVCILVNEAWENPPGVNLDAQQMCLQFEQFLKGMMYTVSFHLGLTRRHSV
jgi:hypothetical protein